MRKKRKYTRHPVTPERVIKKITSIRTKNNKLWMGLLALAFKAKPRIAKKILAGIVENDRLVTKEMAKLGRRKNARAKA